VCGLDRKSFWRIAVLFGAVAISACTPKVQVEAPREPITINLNVKLDADVRLRLIEEANDDVDSNPIF
jgi:hypothetical protein